MDDELRRSVLDRVLPGDDARAESRAMFEEIAAFVADEYGRDARLMGSTAKDTFLAGDKDLDIFVFFDTDVDEETLEEEGLEIGEAVFAEFGGDCTVEYAEHPYTKGEIDGFEVEIVPAYDVASGAEIRSSVDRTPFHTDWVNEHLSEAEKEAVVLLKAFLRGQGLYGPTLRVEGFSGYLCELLVAAYGSFDAVLDAAVDWDEEAVLGPAGHHDEGLPPELEEKFSEDSLVVIDPVDPDRNVAAVLSTENYARFVYAAWRFRQAPAASFFFPETETPDADALEAAAADRGAFVQVEADRPAVVDDILHPQCRRLMRRLRSVLQDHDFRIFTAGYHATEDRVRLLFELYAAELPAARKHVGPKVFHNATHVAQFSDKYDRVWVEDDRLTTVVDREYRDARTLLDDFFDGDLGEKGVPPHLEDPFSDCTVTDLSVDGAAWRRFLRDTMHIEP